MGTDSEEDTEKKKKGAKACTADDDFEAALAENKVEALHTLVEGTKMEPLAAAASEEKNIDLELDAKALANRKKKEKKKAKRNAAVGGEYDGDDPVTTRATDATIDNDAPSSLAAELKNCGKAAPKRESAAARLAREKVDAKRKLDDEKRAFEEAEKARIAEEERCAKEEEDKKDAERQRKRAAELAKIEKQKADGSYQTKAEKERAKQAAHFMEMFGVTVDEVKKIPRATNSKKKGA